MALIQFRVNGSGLLNYAKAGQEAVARIKTAMRKVLNVGRKEARQRITSDFGVRTGFLRRQARKIGVRTSVKAAEIKGQVTPLPRLMNIFEHGATLAHGRGILRPRPVLAPAASSMAAVAEGEFQKVLQKVGQ